VRGREKKGVYVRPSRANEKDTESIMAFAGSWGLSSGDISGLGTSRPTGCHGDAVVCSDELVKFFARDGNGLFARR
jgi:hypothetical protein